MTEQAAATAVDGREPRWPGVAALAVPPVLAWLAGHAIYWAVAAHDGFDYMLVRTHARWDSGNYLSAVGLEPTHGSQHRLQAAVVTSTRLLAYCSVRCRAAGRSSSSTIGRVAARSESWGLALRLLRAAAIATQRPQRQRAGGLLTPCATMVRRSRLRSEARLRCPIIATPKATSEWIRASVVNLRYRP